MDRNELGEVAAETGYDPRRRPWYNFGVSAGTTTITDPELFWAFGLLGFTVAAPYSVDGPRLDAVLRVVDEVDAGRATAGDPRPA